MYRASLRSASRPAVRALCRTTAPRCAPRRFASTASPADRPRTWKGSFVRWGLAAGAVYYYTTSSVFADEQPAQIYAAPPAFSDSDELTVDKIVEEKRRQLDKRAKEAAQQSAETDKQTTSAQSVAAEGSPAALEEEAGQEGAFNPETGEINWDCPCLGGMAHGPCGEEFKTAFSCFVYSNEEPKGMDCIEKFQGMQECFKQYPEIYGSELQDDDNDGDAQALDGVPAETPGEPLIADSQQIRDSPPPTEIKDNSPETKNLPQVKNPEETAVPTKWEDATAANENSNTMKTPREAEGEEKENKEQNVNKE